MTEPIVTVISAGRPASVAKLQPQLVDLETVWIVPERDVQAYQEAGAGAVYADPGSLVQARNMGLDFAHDQGRPCVQLSDDLGPIKMMDSNGGVHGVPLSWAVEQLVASLGDARLAGCSPTGNAFYTDPKKPVKTAHFIVGDLIAVAPTRLRFDERLRLKEDYDYTCQHLSRYGLVARRDDILPVFAHRSNSGGAVAYRTAELEQEAIALLKKKWPYAIKDNPRRPNEVLLKWPTR